MPVEPRIRILENGGWKKEENSRFGAVVEGIFETRNVQTGDVKVFHFAPTLTDLPIIRRLCELVEEVDKHNKALYSLQQEAKNWDDYKKDKNTCSE